MSRSVLVAGVDSSTQSTKIVVCYAATGEILRQASAPHPDGTEVDPEHWWSAYEKASAGGLLDGVAAISVAAQQHGMVVLDDGGTVLRPALLWNDLRSAGAAADLVRELGGPRAWADAVGSVPLASFTVAKLRWLAEHEPAVADRVTSVVLPHDWLTARLTGGTPVTDRGDASGTGYWSPATGTYRDDLVRLAFGRSLKLPDVLGPSEAAPGGGPLLVGAGTGDNMGAALALGLEPGDIAVSIGTSGTAFACHAAAVADPWGEVAGFADATGHFLPLVCTLSASRVLVATAAMLGVDLAGLDALALAGPAGAGGLTLLPYVDGERTPNLPGATGTLSGLTRASMTPAHVARAAVEGVLCSLGDALNSLRSSGITVDRVVLVGGGARSLAVRSISPLVWGVPVVVPYPAEFVALGAARQSAWALTRTPAPPSWSRADEERWEPTGSDGGAVDRYRAARAQAVEGHHR